MLLQYESLFSAWSTCVAVWWVLRPPGASQGNRWSHHGYVYYCDIMGMLLMRCSAGGAGFWLAGTDPACLNSKASGVRQQQWQQPPPDWPVFLFTVSLSLSSFSLPLIHGCRALFLDFDCQELLNQIRCLSVSLTFSPPQHPVITFIHLGLCVSKFAIIYRFFF